MWKTRLYNVLNCLYNERLVNKKLLMEISQVIELNFNEKIQKNYEAKLELIGYLPNEMQLEAINTFLNNRDITENAFFKGLETSVVQLLLSSFTFQNVLQGEHVYNANQPSDMRTLFLSPVYLILKGRINMLLSKKICFKSFIKGSYFGDIELFKKSPRLCSARAETNSTLLVISGEKLQAVLAQYPSSQSCVLKATLKRYISFKLGLEKFKDYEGITRGNKFWDQENFSEKNLVDESIKNMTENWLANIHQKKLVSDSLLEAHAQRFNNLEESIDMSRRMQYSVRMKDKLESSRMILERSSESSESEELPIIRRGMRKKSILKGLGAYSTPKNNFNRSKFSAYLPESNEYPVPEEILSGLATMTPLLEQAEKALSSLTIRYAELSIKFDLLGDRYKESRAKHRQLLETVEKVIDSRKVLTKNKIIKELEEAIGRGGNQAADKGQVNAGSVASQAAKSPQPITNREMKDLSLKLSKNANVGSREGGFISGPLRHFQDFQEEIDCEKDPQISPDQNLNNQDDLDLSLMKIPPNANSPLAIHLENLPRFSDSGSSKSFEDFNGPLEQPLFGERPAARLISNVSGVPENISPVRTRAQTQMFARKEKKQKTLIRLCGDANNRKGSLTPENQGIHKDKIPDENFDRKEGRNTTKKNQSPDVQKREKSPTRLKRNRISRINSSIPKLVVPSEIYRQKLKDFRVQGTLPDQGDSTLRGLMEETQSRNLLEDTSKDMEPLEQTRNSRPTRKASKEPKPVVVKSKEGEQKETSGLFMPIKALKKRLSKGSLSRESKKALKTELFSGQKANLKPTIKIDDQKKTVPVLKPKINKKFSSKKMIEITDYEINPQNESSTSKPKISLIEKIAKSVSQWKSSKPSNSIHSSLAVPNHERSPSSDGYLSPKDISKKNIEKASEPSKADLTPREEPVQKSPQRSGLKLRRKTKVHSKVHSIVSPQDSVQNQMRNIYNQRMGFDQTKNSSFKRRDMKWNTKIVDI